MEQKTEETLKNIINLLKVGITMENGQTRPFDIIDYMFISTLSFDQLLEKASKHLDYFELLLLKRFIYDNVDMVPLKRYDIMEILNTYNEVNPKLDNSGIPIKGTGKLIEPEDKVKVMKFIVGNHIPLTMSTYQAAFRRLMIGGLDVQKVYYDEQIKIEEDPCYDFCKR